MSDLEKLVVVYKLLIRYWNFLPVEDHKRINAELKRVGL